jgi:branched-chain amino acid aminotransferase
MLALLEAHDHGANEALILNTEGHVVCATTSNVFILEEGRVLTPPLTDGALDGITRDFVMRNIPVKEHSLSMERLLSADGVYLTNSINGIRPVEKLNATDLPSRNGFYDDMIRNLSRPAAA